VFLRTLEYQQGILFLTTNRVKSFDEAFLSRFSVAIRYPDHGVETRKKVWSKFLVLAGVDLEGTSPALVSDGSTHANGTGTPKALITKKDLNRFANEPLNGRVVKQTVRTAQALAISNGEPLNAQHVDQILRINKRFQEDFESAAPDYAAAGEGWQSRSSLYR
jgi:SpoVK/Ycf46/Vps4 family AAA+-type ATPase